MKIREWIRGTPSSDFESLTNQIKHEIDKSEFSREFYGELVTTPFRLTESQLRAVMAGLDDSRPVLVRAGPGSGKTSVLVRRYLLLILRGLPPSDILATTFTRRAAAEMKRRIQSRLRQFLTINHGAVPLISNALDDLEADRDWIGTFHALCLRLLRGEKGTWESPLINRLGTDYEPDFDLAGWQVRRDIMEGLMGERSGTGGVAPDTVLHKINKWRLNLVSPAEASHRIKDDLDYIAADLYRDFNTQKLERGVLDFFDLIYYVGQLIRENEEVRVRLQERFTYLLVDEFQDTNPAQQLVVAKLVEDHQRLYAVGDEHQAIYGWRGASSDLIMNFSSHYPTSRQCVLERNFRSTALIVFLANELIDGFENEGTELKPVSTSNSGLDYGIPPGLFAADTAEEEADFIRFYIEKLVEEQGYEYEDIAILHRLNRQKQSMKRELESRSVPVVEMGSAQLFNRDLTDSYLSALRCLRDVYGVNHGSEQPSDELSSHWYRWLLDEHGPLEEDHRPFLEEQESIGELLSGTTTKGENQLDTRTRRQFEDCLDRMDTVAKRLYRGEYLPDLLDTLRECLTVPNRRTSRRHFRECLEWTKNNASRDGIRGLDGLLRKAILQRSDPQSNIQFEGDGVILSTVHGAKGMEFPVVIMPGLEEGWFPHDSQSNGRTTDLAEERRLFFVGVTRAKEELVLSYARRRRLNDDLEKRQSSRFVREIPDEYLEIRRNTSSWWTSVVQFVRDGLSQFTGIR